MSDRPQDSSWLRRLDATVLRWGWLRATVALTLVAFVASLSLTLLAVRVGGHGDPVGAMVVAGLCSLLLTPLLGGLCFRLVFRLDAARRRMAVLATHDELTGVHNRRHFMAVAEREWARCRRYDADGALLLVDVDHFKGINDAHGHPCGDALLREMSRVTAQSLRQPDLLARFGGAELAVFLPHTDPLGALDVAERIRILVGDLRLPWDGLQVNTTVSIGVASIHSGHNTFDALLRDADAALQAAKAAGRNCVRAAPLWPRGLPASGPSVGDRRPAGPV